MPARSCIICGESAVEGFSRCQAHSRGSNWSKKGRPKSSSLNYSSQAWQKRRAQQLAAEPSCAVCGEPATQADHIANMAAGGDPNGALQSLCLVHHRQKTGREGHAARYGQGR